jgi:hypothetical protein
VGNIFGFEPLRLGLMPPLFRGEVTEELYAAASFFRVPDAMRRPAFARRNVGRTAIS